MRARYARGFRKLLSLMSYVTVFLHPSTMSIISLNIQHLLIILQRYKIFKANPNFSKKKNCPMVTFLKFLSSHTGTETSRPIRRPISARPHGADGLGVDEGIFCKHSWSRVASFFSKELELFKFLGFYHFHDIDVFCQLKVRKTCPMMPKETGMRKSL